MSPRTPNSTRSARSNWHQRAGADALTQFTTSAAGQPAVEAAARLVSNRPSQLQQARREDHNNFSHQDPGFIDHVVNKKADVRLTYRRINHDNRVGLHDAPAATLVQEMRARLSAHTQYIREHGEDPPEIRDWVSGADSTEEAIR